MDFPIYQVFEKLVGISGAYTGKGVSRDNYYFSFQRSQIDPDILTSNLRHYGHAQGFDPAKVTWPNGSWPHSGHAITAEEHLWNRCPTVGGLRPFDQNSGERIVYDGIATKSSDYVLGVQGADCPSLFLYDPEANVIGLAHAGWKPVVRGVVQNTLREMIKLGASPEKTLAYIGPGVGDCFNEFQWDDAMEDRIREVFVTAKREDLLSDSRIRYDMNEGDREKVAIATKKEINGGKSFMLSSLIARELGRQGVKLDNVELNSQSTVCECFPGIKGEHATYKYHSARRDNGRDLERPGFGLSLCVLFIEKS
jgi:copper oxidase (laccase) domain-containing protein